jgi:hypothetical protein
MAQSSVLLAPIPSANWSGLLFWSGVLLLVVSKRRRLALLAFAQRVGPDLFAYAPSALEAGAAF